MIAAQLTGLGICAAAALIGAVMWSPTGGRHTAHAARTGAPPLPPISPAEQADVDRIEAGMIPPTRLVPCWLPPRVGRHRAELFTDDTGQYDMSALDAMLNEEADAR